MKKQKQKQLKEPLSWLDISTFSFYNPPKFNIGREFAVEQKYIQYKLTLVEKDISNTENIMLLFKNENENDNENENKYNLQLNNFPYYLTENIKHYVLWINPKYEKKFFVLDGSKNEKKNIKKLDKDFIENIICNSLFNGDKKKCRLECVFFQNLEKFRSIKNILHIHVFILC